MTGTTIKVPVVLAEKDVEVLVSNREILEPSALKIYDIVTDIRNITTDVVVLRLPDTAEEACEDNENNFKVKVIIQGILHKQIFWVGKRDNTIHHMQVNEPFSTFVVFDNKSLKEPIGNNPSFCSSAPEGFEFDEDKITADIWEQEVEAVVSNLVSPNRFNERVLLGFTVKLEQLAQIAVETDD